MKYAIITLALVLCLVGCAFEVDPVTKEIVVKPEVNGPPTTEGLTTVWIMLKYVIPSQYNNTPGTVKYYIYETFEGVDQQRKITCIIKDGWSIYALERHCHIDSRDRARIYGTDLDGDDFSIRGDWGRYGVKSTVVYEGKERPKRQAHGFDDE